MREGGVQKKYPESIPDPVAWETGAQKSGGEEAFATGWAAVRVVVVSYNTRDLTLQCVRAIRRSEIGNLSVCVVDNASEDGSVEALRNSDSSVEIITLPRNVGFGGANNRGVGNANAPFVALVNSDAFVRENTLSTLRKYLEAHPQVGIVGPRLLNADGSPQACWFPFPGPVRAWGENLGLLWGLRGVLRWISRIRGRASVVRSARVDWVSGACLMVRREVWMATRGFDEQFFLYSEETDWQRRVSDLGWEIHGVADAVATHLGGASGTGATGATREFFWEGVDRYFRLHFGWGGVVSLRAATAVGAVLRGMGCMFTGHWERASRWWGIVRRQCTRPVPQVKRCWVACETEGAGS